MSSKIIITTLLKDVKISKFRARYFAGQTSFFLAAETELWYCVYRQRTAKNRLCDLHNFYFNIKTLELYWPQQYFLQWKLVLEQLVMF